ncbi:hypothetical protein GW17_00040298 [Ensete ventricosum]|nr:hypothetical protein GW17_00040298 [Ensete ventricosum]
MDLPLCVALPRCLCMRPYLARPPGLQGAALTGGRYAYRRQGFERLPLHGPWPPPPLPARRQLARRRCVHYKNA